MKLQDGYSTGKRRTSNQLERHQALLAVFVVGLCAGTMISERIYLAANRADILSGRRLPPAAAGLTRSSSSSSSRVVGTMMGGGTSTQRAMVPPHGAPLSAARVAEAASVAAANARSLDETSKRLHALLRRVAPGKEVLVAVSNATPLREGMLDTFLSGLQRAGVTNYVIISLDKETEQALSSRGANAFLLPLTVGGSQADTGDNHAISSLKFGIIRRFLELGWAVLLSDVDVCILSDPFQQLYR